jgi:hypothetical protein
MSPVDCLTVVQGVNGVCGTIYPTFGITGTPVINTNADGTTLYVVAEMQSESGANITYYHLLHALDITSLAEGCGNERYGAPNQICSTSTCGSYPNASSFSQAHIQRPGLLFAPETLTKFSDDYIYIAFSMMDGYDVPNFPNGMLLGYDAENLSFQLFHSRRTFLP